MKPWAWQGSAVDWVPHLPPPFDPLDRPPGERHGARLGEGGGGGRLGVAEGARAKHPWQAPSEASTLGACVPPSQPRGTEGRI